MYTLWVNVHPEQKPNDTEVNVYNQKILITIV
jgi:hypothetical protein